MLATGRRVFHRHLPAAALLPDGEGDPVGAQSFEQFVTDIDTLRITSYEEIVATIRAERTG
jgi:hypothetical protein